MHELQATESAESLEPGDQRVLIIYIIQRMQDQTRDRNIRQQALTYILLNDKLYRRIIDVSLCNCLDSYQSRLAMGEVHEAIYMTH